MSKSAQSMKPKGSVIYKILIVALLFILIFSIRYPKTLWDKEEKRTKQCHKNMEHIMYAELIYLQENNSYTDTLSKVIDFIKNDTTGKYLRMFTGSDSVLSESIFDQLKKDSLAAAIIDTLNRYGYRYNIDTTATLILDSLKTYPEYAKTIDSMSITALEEMRECPTVNRPYIISVLDTSAIKELYIYCPLDSLDSIKVVKNFKLHKLGGLKITNHGNIQQGENSW